MNRTIVAAATLACFALTAKADYIIKERFEHSGQVQQITLKIKESKIRLDDGDSASAVVDSETGMTTLLIHPDKAFLKISPDQVKEQTKALKEMLGQKLDNPADVQLKSTGKQEKINGFDTEEYTTNFNGDPDEHLYRKTVSKLPKDRGSALPGTERAGDGCFSQHVNSSRQISGIARTHHADNHGAKNCHDHRLCAGNGPARHRLCHSW